MVFQASEVDTPKLRCVIRMKRLLQVIDHIVHLRGRVASFSHFILINGRNPTERRPCFCVLTKFAVEFRCVQVLDMFYLKPLEK